MSAPSAELFRSSTSPGFSARIESDPRRRYARKQAHEIEVRFASDDGTVATREGTVQVKLGDAILTGTAGEHWRVSALHFAAKYDAVPPTLMGQPGRYVSRSNRIIAVPMDRPFEVLLSDGISRLRGKPGDWLVDYGDGSLGVIAPAIFATTYDLTDA